MMCWNWMFQWPSNQLSTSQVDTLFGGVMGSWVVVFRVFLLSSRLPPWKISLAQKCWSLIFGGRAGATEDGDMELRLPQGVGEALLVGWKNGYPQKTDIAMEHSPFLIGVSSSNGCSSSVMLVFHVFRAVLPWLKSDLIIEAGWIYWCSNVCMKKERHLQTELAHIYIYTHVYICTRIYICSINNTPHTIYNISHKFYQKTHNTYKYGIIYNILTHFIFS